MYIYIYIDFIHSRLLKILTHSKIYMHMYRYIYIHIYIYIFEASRFAQMAKFDWFRKSKNFWISLPWNNEALHQSVFGYIL